MSAHRPITIHDRTGKLIKTCSTRKKATARAKTLTYRGYTSYVEVRFWKRGEEQVLKFGDVGEWKGN